MWKVVRSDENHCVNSSKNIYQTWKIFLLNWKTPSKTEIMEKVEEMKQKDEKPKEWEIEAAKLLFLS